jgi:hypothetical protein
MRTLLLGVVHSHRKEACVKSGHGAKGSWCFHSLSMSISVSWGNVGGKVEINQVLTPAPLYSSAFDRFVQSRRFFILHRDGMEP